MFQCPLLLVHSLFLYLCALKSFAFYLNFLFTICHELLHFSAVFFFLCIFGDIRFCIVNKSHCSLVKPFNVLQECRHYSSVLSPCTFFHSHLVCKTSLDIFLPHHVKTCKNVYSYWSLFFSKYAARYSIALGGLQNINQK